MNALTKLIFDDMRPALGVTEPGAIAFAAATARKYAGGEKVIKAAVHLNSGIYKNAFTCGIPGFDRFGNDYAAALGAAGADSEKGLECLETISEDTKKDAVKLVEEGNVSVDMTEITSRIFIETEVTTDAGTASVTIRDSHTNIVKITVNGKTVFEKEAASENGPAQHARIHEYTLQQIYDYVKNVPSEEISFINKAHEMNIALCNAGLTSEKTTFAHFLYNKNGRKLISDSRQFTAELICGSAIEARVMGLPYPAMSITGSGSHGIIATMPLYAVSKIMGCTEEMLLRATALSFLVCMYIKEFSGKLSAFCGCAVAAGTGAACGIVFLEGGDCGAMEKVINYMASGITGLICDGGNQGCTVKGLVAVDSAIQAADLALSGVYVDSIHGINGKTPEKTMEYMGKIASPGMIGTEKTILEILEEKSRS